MISRKINAETHPLTWWLGDKLDQDYTVYFKEYSKKNGYLAFKKALRFMSSQDIKQLVLNSGLKGRGGAGFLTGLKWNLISNDLNIKNRYIICNADEMEPGTYKDRFLMEKIPHQLLEGILLSGLALQATCGYIFLRGEYHTAEKILNKSIKEIINAGYLGKNILGSDFSFNIFIHTGAGRYICGEETALINSLEGKRANPRSKPPFPGMVGLWGKPTCVNNVETLSNIPAIVLNGVSWYKNLSNSLDSGTKIMGFSGCVKKPGLWEVPFGITARELLEFYAGGMRDGLKLKAWQPGGAGTDFLLEKHLDTPMDFNSIRSIGSRLGTAISMVVDNTINIVSLVYNIEKFFSRESCGWCTPCREGLPWIVHILRSLKDNKGCVGDIEILEELCVSLGPGKTFCALAPGAIEPLQSAIKFFRSEFECGIKF
ncbi:NADH-quinone oxidoreductase subunit NuoF [Buchnera aphidicola (Mollitrichosiphum nigrofasciatum)]|uniref:NADH-quinone oxidoreductase subunit NuoF n=1 Tax=Buchnera aphidicola TaxID=9 RepID=UPI0031B85441